MVLCGLCACVLVCSLPVWVCLFALVLVVPSQILAKYDFEDVVGGMKTRFKYRQVPSSDYGLKTEDILAAEDKALNR